MLISSTTKLYGVLAIFLLLQGSSVAQVRFDTVELKRQEITIITGDSKLYKGYLAFGNDTSLTISSYKIPARSSIYPQSALQNFKLSDINLIRVKKKGWVKPTAIGFAIGALIGGLLVPKTDDEGLFAGLEDLGNTVNYTLIGGAIGSGIGLAISLSPRKEFIVNGQKESLISFVNRKRK